MASTIALLAPERRYAFNRLSETLIATFSVRGEKVFADLIEKLDAFPSSPHGDEVVIALPVRKN